MNIAVDAYGGDHAPQEIVKGAIEASREYGLKITLLGDRDTIEKLLNDDENTGLVRLVHCTQNITCHDHPVQAVRSKPGSSIVKGVQMVKEKSADAFVSAGNTGAVLAASCLILERIPGIERPAICVVVPVGTGGPFLLLDAGANADCQPRYLVQFARLGASFARLYLGIPNPRIGLLNNGEEEAKGSMLSRETCRMMKESDLNFTGNVEGQDILGGRFDVLVTDGFTGNIVLKVMEGVGELLQNIFALKKETGGAADSKGHVSTLLKHMDFSEHGGSCLLGLKGNIIICHGRSKARAIKTAIRFAAQAVEADIAGAIVNDLAASIQHGEAVTR